MSIKVRPSHLQMLAIGLSTLVAIYVLVLHLATVYFPWQIDSREGALLLQVVGRLHGVKVWNVEALPEYVNVYGLLYTEVGAFIANIFGANFLVLRMITFISILGVILILNALLSKLGLTTSQRVLLCLSFYIGQLFPVASHARPDELGMLSFMLGLYLMEIKSDSSLTPVAILVLSFVGFLAKLYFVILGPLACSYIYFYKSRRLGVMMSVAFVVAMVVLLGVLDKFFPTYITSVIGVTLGGGPRISAATSRYMGYQWVCFFGMHLGVLVMALLSLRFVKKDLKDGNSQLWPSFSTYSAAIVAVLLTFSIGHHKGNFLTYYNQLLLPFLLVSIGRILVGGGIRFTKREAIGQITAALLAAASVAYLPKISAFQYISSFVAGDTSGLRRLDVLIGQHKKVLAVSVAAGMQVSQGMKVFDSGQSEYFHNSVKHKLPWLGLEKSEITHIVEKSEFEISEKIRTKYFDLAVTYEKTPVDWIEALLRSGYQVNERIVLSPPFNPSSTILVWSPSTYSSSYEK
jgi:hypothetical protein